MKSFRFILHLLLIIISSTSCFAENPVKESWWLTIQVEADQVKLNGIPVKHFNDDWNFARFIDNAIIENKITEEEYRNFKDSPFSFKKNNDLNKNGIDESISVGVFVAENDKSGVFLAIFENDRLLKVLTDSTHNNFTALLIHDGDLLWYRCMECGSYERVVWTGTSYFLE